MSRQARILDGVKQKSETTLHNLRRKLQNLEDLVVNTSNNNSMSRSGLIRADELDADSFALPSASVGRSGSNVPLWNHRTEHSGSNVPLGNDVRHINHRTEQPERDAHTASRVPSGGDDDVNDIRVRSYHKNDRKMEQPERDDFVLPRHRTDRWSEKDDVPNRWSEKDDIPKRISTEQSDMYKPLVDSDEITGIKTDYRNPMGDTTELSSSRRPRQRDHGPIQSILKRTHSGDRDTKKTLPTSSNVSSLSHQVSDPQQPPSPHSYTSHRHSSNRRSSSLTHGRDIQSKYSLFI